jgi:hypothetical protein
LVTEGGVEGTGRVDKEDVDCTQVVGLDIGLGAEVRETGGVCSGEGSKERVIAEGTGLEEGPVDKGNKSG